MTNFILCLKPFIFVSVKLANALLIIKRTVMKNVKTTFIALAAVLAFSLSAQAQVREEKTLSNEDKTEIIQQVKTNTARLELTEDQKAPYRELNKAYGEKLQAIRSSDKISVEKIKAVQEAKDEREAGIKKLLTADQFKIYQQIQEERKARMAAKKQG